MFCIAYVTWSMPTACWCAEAAICEAACADSAMLAAIERIDSAALSDRAAPERTTLPACSVAITALPSLSSTKLCASMYCRVGGVVASAIYL